MIVYVYIYICTVHIYNINLELVDNIPQCSNIFHNYTDIPHEFPEVTQEAQAFWHLDQCGLILQNGPLGSGYSTFWRHPTLTDPEIR